MFLKDGWTFIIPTAIIPHHPRYVMDLLSKLLTETYYLFHYTLSSTSGGATQKSRTCGQDYTIEEAFSAARTLVLQDYANLCRQTEAEGAAGSQAVRINETEFGYDLVHNHRVVSRYWIHPKRVLTT
jgi:hypothetical protein